MPPFPVYLFDVDGTLLDSIEDVCGAILEVLASTRCRNLQMADLKRYVGVHLLDMFRDLLPEYSDERHEELIRSYRTVYPARRHQATRVFPGVAEALEAMRGRKSTATTKASATTRAILEQFGLLPYFEHVQGTDGFPYKPAPDVIHAALEALGARPEDCLFVGDAPADMEAGRRAGVRICAVRYGYGDPAALARWQPDYWVGDLRELVS
jgi:HAD superfamily hydrolase (TIGR01509 family)